MPFTKPVELVLAGITLGETGFSVTDDDITDVVPVNMEKWYGQRLGAASM